MLIPAPAGGYKREGDPGEPTTGKPRVSISDQEATILSALGAGRRVLEIGTGLGVSTRALAWRATSIDTVDIDPWVHEHIFPELYADLDVSIACHVDPVHLIRGFDEFDLCFIDADHSSPAVRADIEFVRQFDPWLIVLHDAGYPSVARAIAGETWLHINTEHGLAIGR